MPGLQQQAGLGFMEFPEAMNAKATRGNDGNGRSYSNTRFTCPTRNLRAPLICQIKADTEADYPRQYVSFVCVASHREGLIDPTAVSAEYLPAAATGVIR